MSETGKKSKARAGGAGGGKIPEGPDRVLLFADSLQADKAEEEAREQQLETWVTCQIAAEVFSLPVRQVQEILRVTSLTRVPHAPFPVRGVTNLRGSVLPVVDLRVRLGLEPVEIGPRHRVIVLSSHGRLIGLLVDAVDQVVTIDRLTVQPPPEDVMTAQSYYLIGVYDRGDEMIILLDADRILQVRDADDVARARG